MLRFSLIIFFIFPLSVFGIDFTFQKGSTQWQGDFCDYPADAESFYELAWGWENLPVPVETSGVLSLEKGLFLEGNNHSDDLFMFVRRKIGGLEPNTEYAVDMKVLIETNAPAQASGIGGAPGENVYVKAGVSTLEPKKILRGGYYFLTVDKGNQSEGSAYCLVIGTLAHEDVDANNPTFLPKQLCTAKHLFVQTDQNGEFWIFLGTDSGFEGKTKFYIAQVQLSLDVS